MRSFGARDTTSLVWRVFAFHVAVAALMTVVTIALAAGRASGQAFSPSAAIADLKSDKPELRGAAAQALGNNQAKGGVGPLLDALKTEKTLSIRAAMIAALGAIRDAKASADLLQIAKTDAEPGLRAAAVSALNRIGDAASLNAIERLAKDPSQPVGVRVQSLEIVGARRGHRGIPTLLNAAEEKDPVVRREALRALGKMRDPLADSALERGSKDADPEVRKVSKSLIDRRTKKQDDGSGKDKK
ncbi:MAG: HEAT repeat domain-containing protein [Elusimicrobia bacterium]|nr:HEAT repeat domain-containing protein [Elusimicrobiota bacterium]